MLSFADPFEIALHVLEVIVTYSTIYLIAIVGLRTLIGAIMRWSGNRDLASKYLR